MNAKKSAKVAEWKSSSLADLKTLSGDCDAIVDAVKRHKELAVKLTKRVNSSAEKLSDSEYSAEDPDESLIESLGDLTSVDVDDLVQVLAFMKSYSDAIAELVTSVSDVKVR